MTEVNKKLISILAWPRPHDSVAELAFREWVAAEITAAGYSPMRMAAGCISVEVGAGKSTTLFSCHMDTVDNPAEGLSPTARKQLTYDRGMGVIALDRDSKCGTCLGADDGAGIWIMLNMIDAGVPGTYLFHTGEEVGGVGSRAMLAAHTPWLRGFTRAIAFDRPHNDEVITHQGGMECCSQEFAAELCTLLGGQGLAYVPSNKGVFTDTKVYRGVIAECTNIGVGYMSQHGPDEALDYTHACELLAAAKKIDWSTLPVKRDPLKPDTMFDRGYQSTIWTQRQPQKKKKSPVYKAPVYKDPESAYDELVGSTAEELRLWVEDAPGVVAASMMSMLREIGRLRADCAVMQKLLGETQ